MTGSARGDDLVTEKRTSRPNIRTTPRARKLSNVLPATPFEGGGPQPVRKVRDSMTAISRMIRAEDLSVVFQPIVHVETIKTFAYEALVRCKVPEFANPT